MLRKFKQEQFLLKLENKIFKHFKYNYFQVTNVNSEQKKINKYTPKDKIIFENNKSLIYLAAPSMKNNMKRFNFLSNVSLVLGSYKFIINALYINPIFMVLWLGVIGAASIIKININKNQKSIIDSIYLLDDGKHIEINLVNKEKRIENISLIRKATKKEFAALFMVKNNFMQSFVPFITNSFIFLMPKDHISINSEILSAISNSSHINIENKDEKIVKVKQ